MFWIRRGFTDPAVQTDSRSVRKHSMRPHTHSRSFKQPSCPTQDATAAELSEQMPKAYAVPVFQIIRGTCSLRSVVDEVAFCLPQFLQAS